MMIGEAIPAMPPRSQGLRKDMATGFRVRSLPLGVGRWALGVGRSAFSSVAMLAGGEPGAEGFGPGLIGGDAHVRAGIALAGELHALEEGAEFREVAFPDFRRSRQHPALLLEADE